MTLIWISGNPTKIGLYLFRIRGGQIFAGKIGHCPDRKDVLQYQLTPNPWWYDLTPDSILIDHIGPLEIKEPNNGREEISHCD